MYHKVLYWASILFNLHERIILGYFSSIAQLFADDTSNFSIVNDITVSEQVLNSDLQKIYMWVYQWKISFNPDASKQAQEVIFSKKVNKLSQSFVLFINIHVQNTSTQRYLGVDLDKRRNFNPHIREK